MNQLGLLWLTLLLFARDATSEISNGETYCVTEPNSSVICRTFESFHIRNEFERISSILPSYGKLFQQLIIYYLPVQVLPDNLFFDLQFAQISIHQTYNLTSIHSNAFNSSTSITEHLHLIETNNLVNNPPDYDLYAAISSLRNLKTVAICLSNIHKHEIPENSFQQINGPQENLEVIEFRGDFIISRINDNAFSQILNIKRWIIFSNIQIEYISEQALDFLKSSEDRLEVHFNGCGLNETSFANNLFSGSQRPLYINLDNNNIRIIKESTFENFFHAHVNNTMSIANNPLDCDNKTHFQWLLDRKIELQNRILNATCSDGISLWDTDNDAITCQVSINLPFHTINCNNNYTSSTLKWQFKILAQTFPYLQFNYVQIWNNDQLTDLPENLLMGLNVVSLDVQNSTNLRYIHINSFQTTISDLIVFNNSLINSPPEFDTYYAFVRSNASRINFTLDLSIDHIIPDNSFHRINGLQNKLVELNIGFNKLKRIGKNIIYDILSLNVITFTGNQIESIASNAFDYELPSNTTLYITFHDLEYIGFDENMFGGSMRPIQLQFTNDYSLQYIDENIFSAFFTADARNQLILYNSRLPLNCTDIRRFVWLLRQKEALKNRIQNPFCEDNTLIWNLDFTEISWPTNILLILNNVTDIREEFQRISDNLPDDRKHFEMLELYYAPITELPENSFVDISFTQIYLHDLHNLTAINTKAFNGTETNVEILQIIGLNVLINSPPNNDLYAAISSFINLKSVLLSLGNNIGHEIPINAFKQIKGPQNSFENITFSGDYWITAINDNAFTAITNLKSIVFSSISIHYISSKAFDFNQTVIKSNDVLEIHLNDCGLNETSFANNVFSNSQRPLYIDLNTNQLKYLRENTFRVFLYANPLNNISLENNPLNCDDMYEFEWLLNRKPDLENRVLNARCSNGIKLWDLDLPHTQAPNGTTGMTPTDTDITSSDTDLTSTESVTDDSVSETDTETIITPIISTTITSLTQTTLTSMQTPLETIKTTYEFVSTATTPESISSPLPLTSTTQNSTFSYIPTETQTTITPDSRLCNEDYSYNGQYYIYKWPPVRPGETSHGECQTGYFGSAQWFCGHDSKFDRNGPHITCTQSWIDDLYNDITDDNITSINQVINYISLLDKNLTENDITYYVELVKFVEMVELLQYYSHVFIDSDQYLNEAKIITTNIIVIYSNLISRAKPWIEANQFEKSVISERLVLHVQYASFLLGCQLNTTATQSINRNNIYVETFKLNETGYTLESSRTNSTIIIPANVGIRDTNLKQFCPKRTAFAVIYERIDEYFSLNLSDSESIATNIIGFSFTNDTNTYTINNGLKAKIILLHKFRLSFGDKIRCAFWDFAESQWSSNGCERIVNESNRDITTCECNHLTNFAAILDMSGRETNGGLKSTFTTVCSSMSCMGLIMTIIMIFLSKSNKRKKEKIAELRDNVTCNLCFCLIMVNLLVIFGMSQTNIKWLCQTLSALLLYSLLSAFCWMLFEGLIVYKMTVQVFPDYFRHIKLLNYMLAYGTPILVIIIALTIVSLTNIYNDFAIFDVLFKDESNNYFCWISSSVTPYYIWIFAGPASLIMLTNLIILILSIKSVCGAVKPNYMLVIGYTSFIFFLGLTWLFFILYIEQFGHYFAYFSYFFIIINGSQGVFIHLFQTIQTARTEKYGNESSDGVNYES